MQTTKNLKFPFFIMYCDTLCFAYKPGSFRNTFLAINLDQDMKLFVINEAYSYTRLNTKNEYTKYTE